MQIKLLQLNMWGGALFPALETFLQEYEFDILSLQEVTGQNTHCGNLHSTDDQFEKLQNLLGQTYYGELFANMKFTSDVEHSFEGNAIFYKKKFLLIRKNEIVLYKGINPFPSDITSYEEMSRNALHLTLSVEGKQLEIVSTHLAWASTPLEQPHQRKQNLKLLAYMKHLSSPWILTGDFNIQPDQPTILDLEQLGKNLIKEHNIANTLDPATHNAWEKIKPGFPVDYIFVSPDIEVKQFEALESFHISDHIGLTATIEV